MNQLNHEVREAKLTGALTLLACIISLTRQTTTAIGKLMPANWDFDKSPEVAKQKIEISGRDVDHNEFPLPGVSVMVKGKKNVGSLLTPKGKIQSTVTKKTFWCFLLSGS